MINESESVSDIGSKFVICFWENLVTFIQIKRNGLAEGAIKIVSKHFKNSVPPLRFPAKITDDVYSDSWVVGKTSIALVPCRRVRMPARQTLTCASHLSWLQKRQRRFLFATLFRSMSSITDFFQLEITIRNIHINNKYFEERPHRKTWELDRWHRPQITQERNCRQQIWDLQIKIKLLQPQIADQPQVRPTADQLQNKAKQSSCSFLLFLCHLQALKFTLLFCQNGQPREPYYRKHFRIEPNYWKNYQYCNKAKPSHTKFYRSSRKTWEHSNYFKTKRLSVRRPINSSRKVSKQTVSFFLLTSTSQLVVRYLHQFYR